MRFDDFIITNFNSGNVATFPKFIYVAATRGIPAQANVIGSSMFLLAFVLVVGSELVALAAGERAGVRVSVVLDSVDPAAILGFWEEALGYRLAADLGAFLVLVSQDDSPDGRAEPVVILQRVPEEPTGKNRMHVDLHPPDPEAHIARLENLGERRLGERVTELQEQFGIWWQQMADPQGNEFCVVADADPPAPAEED